ncbi:MAG: flavin reductase family protein [Candidatus Thorarchaeota archaeon]
MDNKIKAKILKYIPYGLYVVTSISSDQLMKNAFSASWLTQISFKPPLLALASQEDSLSTKLILDSKKFVVNFVDESQSDIIKYFFTPAHKKDKISDHHWSFGKHTGCPILDEGLAYLECLVRDSIALGDHTLIIGEIIDAVSLREGEPLHIRHTPWSYSG